MTIEQPVFDEARVNDLFETAKKAAVAGDATTSIASIEEANAIIDAYNGQVDASLRKPYHGHFAIARKAD